MLHSVAYVAFQELATRISHRNTGHQSGDPVCDRMLARIATDENLHMVFYRNLVKAAFELAPDLTMRAVRDVVVDFRMPGHGIPGFERAAAQMAIGEVYNLRIHHDDVLQPVLRFLKVMEVEGLGPEGRQAQEELGMFMDGLDADAPRTRSAGPDSTQEQVRSGSRRRLIWRRSFSDSPPQTPKRSSLPRAYSRQAVRIGHRPQMRLASRTELPGSGKKKSPPVCAHNASCCHSRSGEVIVCMCMPRIVPGAEKRPVNAGSTRRRAGALRPSHRVPSRGAAHGGARTWRRERERGGFTS
jgi:hypothetical protein